MIEVATKEGVTRPKERVRWIVVEENVLARLHSRNVGLRYFLDFVVPHQRAKKVVSDSPGLVDFATGLVNSVLNLPEGQVKIFRRIKITKVL